MSRPTWAWIAGGTCGRQRVDPMPDGVRDPLPDTAEPFGEAGRFVRLVQPYFEELTQILSAHALGEGDEVRRGHCAVPVLGMPAAQQFREACIADPFAQPWGGRPICDPTRCSGTLFGTGAPILSLSPCASITPPGGGPSRRR